jgi:hypothetical protein
VQLWDPAAPAEPGSEVAAVPPKPLDVAYACGPTFCSPPARSKAALETTLGRQLASW